MNRPENILTLIFLSLSLTSCGQTKTTDTKSDNYKALAKLVSFEGGDKIHFAKFQIIKDLSDSTFLRDTITVGYYNYKEPDNDVDTVLLTIKRYHGQASLRNYFICPDYDGKVGIRKAKINFINFDYWEGCETEKGDCKTLNFVRKKTGTNWFLIMPCGGTEATISISGKNFSKELHLYHDNCPPYLDLTTLKDGNYSANMRSCGLGGAITFNLTTTE